MPGNYKRFLGRLKRFLSPSKARAGGAGAPGPQPESLVELWHAMRRQVGLKLAFIYRRALLRRVVFIGVTGSCGKTTTKELIAGVLLSQFKGRRSYAYFNRPTEIARTILGVRPWHAFCVQEISAAGKGGRIPLEGPLGLVKPQIGVITTIGTDHAKAFGTLEATAAHKGKLIAALPPYGTAVLNADDAHVLAMQARCSGRIITYGRASNATVRAENISSRWPERLSFTVFANGQSHAVQTQLCGEHWVSRVLAALAVGV